MTRTASVAGAIALVAGAVALVACGEPPLAQSVATSARPAAISPDERASPEASASPRSIDAEPKSYERALRVVRSEWEGILMHLDASMSTWGNGMDTPLRTDDTRFQHVELPCRDKLAALRRSAPNVERFALSGALVNLEREGTCHVVFFAGGMKREVEFVLDGDTNQVLFAWRVPEG